MNDISYIRYPSANIVGGHVSYDPPFSVAGSHLSTDFLQYDRRRCVRLNV